MAHMLDRLRKQPPQKIGGLPVTRFEDLRDEEGRFGPLKGATDAAARNVLLFRFGDQARVALRPSGTEPKAKVYLEACSPPCPASASAETWLQICRQVDELAKAIASEFKQLALAGIGKPAP